MLRRDKLREKVNKLVRHEKSARLIGSIAEADAFAKKISALRALDLSRRWRRNSGQRPSEFVFYQLLHSRVDRSRACRQICDYISELETMVRGVRP